MGNAEALQIHAYNAMKLTCCINNFNYGHYLAEAVNSAFSQSVPFDEVIVVDDGSNDTSREILSALERRYHKLKVIYKDNGGQLSAFSKGLAESTGDIIYFLDSDDIYKPDYVEKTAGVYQQRPEVGYVFTGRHLFGLVDKVDHPAEEELDLGYSAALLATSGAWIGGSTSCVSMRRSTLELLLPAEEVEPWCHINADLCLALGSSLSGVKKYCIPEQLIGYRVHGQNRYYGKSEDSAGKYMRRFSTEMLIEFYLKRFNLNRRQLSDLLHLEFASIPKPSKQQEQLYIKALRKSSLGIVRRGWQAFAIWRHYQQTRKISSPRESLGLYSRPNELVETLVAA